MLDLANLITLDSDGFAVYRQTWEAVTGSPLDMTQPNSATGGPHCKYRSSTSPG
jgi:hypothetical protein